MGREKLFSEVQLKFISFKEHENFNKSGPESNPKPEDYNLPNQSLITCPSPIDMNNTVNLVHTINELNWPKDKKIVELVEH